MLGRHGSRACWTRTGHSEPRGAACFERDPARCAHDLLAAGGPALDGVDPTWASWLTLHLVRERCSRTGRPDAAAHLRADRADCARRGDRPAGDAGFGAATARAEVLLARDRGRTRRRAIVRAGGSTRPTAPSCEWEAADGRLVAGRALAAAGGSGTQAVALLQRLGGRDGGARQRESPARRGRARAAPARPGGPSAGARRAAAGGRRRAHRARARDRRVGRRRAFGTSRWRRRSSLQREDDRAQPVAGVREARGCGRGSSWPLRLAGAELRAAAHGTVRRVSSRKLAPPSAERLIPRRAARRRAGPPRRRSRRSARRRRCRPRVQLSPPSSDTCTRPPRRRGRAGRSPTTRGASPASARRAGASSAAVSETKRPSAVVIAIRSGRAGSRSTSSGAAGGVRSSNVRPPSALTSRRAPRPAGRRRRRRARRARAGRPRPAARAAPTCARRRRTGPARCPPAARSRVLRVARADQLAGRGEAQHEVGRDRAGRVRRGQLAVERLGRFAPAASRNAPSPVPAISVAVARVDGQRPDERRGAARGGALAGAGSRSGPAPRARSPSPQPASAAMRRRGGGAVTARN